MSAASASNASAYDQQLVLVLSSAVGVLTSSSTDGLVGLTLTHSQNSVRSFALQVLRSPSDAVQAILSAESFAREINQVGPLGSSALHLATWRSHVGIVRSVLDACNADVDVQDEESGWTALHRALYHGNVRVASLLMQAGANGALRDHRGRRAVDLVSRTLVRHADVVVADAGDYASYGHVFSWGNGSNYTLGTGSLEVELAPSRVDALHAHDVVRVGAAKFHSAVVTADGKLFTWGWGRGGRLGHPEPSIHAGSSAVIHPRLVASLAAGGKVVKEVAVAKHHTLLTTIDGELFSMGSNRHGQLGHGRETAAAKSVAVPKKVAALRSSFVVKIAAANKHSVAVTSTGEVYTWGSNTCGQLGYGAFDSTSSPTPRVVDAMKGKRVVACAAAKRHTVVLTTDGDVLTWGHRGVSPRKVNLNSVRKSASLDGTPLRFQKGYKDVLKPRVERICAGAAHTSVLTTTGVVLTWRSADPHCHVQEVGGLLAGARVVDISAGKYRTAAVTDIGTVYMWEGRADYNPTEGRQAGSGSKKGMHMLGSSVDSMSSHDGSYLGSSPGSLSYRFGSPSVLSDRVQSRFKAGGAAGAGAACSQSPSGGSYKGSHLGFGSGLNNGPGEGLVVHGGHGWTCHGGTPSASALASASASSHLHHHLHHQQHHHQQQHAFELISPTAVDGLRRITHVAVGEKHSVALQSWLRSGDDYFSVELVNDGAGDDQVEACAYTFGPSSLQVQCEETIAKHMVDPHTVLQVMMYAEAAGADMLYRRCCCVAALNLDIVITEHPHIFAEMPRHLLRDIEIELERVMARGSNVSLSAKSRNANDDVVFLTPTCHRNLKMRRPSRADRSLGDREDCDFNGIDGGADVVAAGFDDVVDVVDVAGDGTAAAASWMRDVSWYTELPSPAQCSTPDTSDVSEELAKLRRLILKKLEQIHVLEEKARGGIALDFQQSAKLGQKGVVMSALAALEGGVPHDEVNALLRAASQAVVGSQQRTNTSASASADLLESRESKEPRESSRPVKPKPPKSKRKSKNKDTKDIKEEKGKETARNAGTASDTSRLVDAAAASLRQIRIGDGGSGGGPPATNPAASRSTDARTSTASQCIVGFSPQGEIPEPRHSALSPIKTVGFRPMDGGDPSSPLSSSSGRTEQPIQSSGGKQPTRKGGLTMFLRGELDNASGAAKPAAWGGPAKVETPVSPLSKWFSDNGRPPKPDRDRDTTASSLSSSKQTLGKIHAPGGSAKPKKVSLASFMGDKMGEKVASPVAWSSEKASPSSSKPIKSLRTIQDEQEELRAATRRITFARSPPTFARTLGADAGPTTSFHAHSLGTSPHSAGPGFLYGSSPHSSGKNFVASGPAESRWYISEEQSMQAAKAKSLKDIEAEEMAAKEIAGIEQQFRELEQEQEQEQEKERNRAAGPPKPPARRPSGGRSRRSNHRAKNAKNTHNAKNQTVT